MTRYALLLRGVNVGGRSTLSMADLRAALESIGCGDVTTYLRSGNAVVTAPATGPEADTGPDALARRAEEALAARAGLDTRILVRTGAELAGVIAANPYPEALDKPALLHVVFLSEQPVAADVAGLDAAAYAPDAFRLGDHAIYLRFAVSSGRSRLSPALGRQLARTRPGLVATARNWNTVLKLAALTGG